MIVWAALHDAKNFRVSNATVLILVGLYVMAQGVLGFPTWSDDLAGGALLFGLGFLMWLMRILGAGDAKLMLPVGAFLGLQALGPFAFLLIIFSFVMYAAILLSHVFKASGGFFGWLATMRTEGKVPYAVPLAMSAVPVLVLKAYLGLVA